MYTPHATDQTLLHETFCTWLYTLIFGCSHPQLRSSTFPVCALWVCMCREILLLHLVCVSVCLSVIASYANQFSNKPYLLTVVPCFAVSWSNWVSIHTGRHDSQRQTWKLRFICTRTNLKLIVYVMTVLPVWNYSVCVYVPVQTLLSYTFSLCTCTCSYGVHHFKHTLHSQDLHNVFWSTCYL